MTSGRSSSIGPGGIHGELAESYRRISRLRYAWISVIVLAVLVIGGAVWLGGDIRSDPTDRAMQELELPAWKNGEIHEEVEGSRWCWQSCRVRVRTWHGIESFHQLRDGAAQHDWRESPTVECEGKSVCLVRDDLVLYLQIQPSHCNEESSERASAVASLLITSLASWPRIDR